MSGTWLYKYWIEVPVTTVLYWSGLPWSGLFGGGVFMGPQFVLLLFVNCRADRPNDRRIRRYYGSQYRKTCDESANLRCALVRSAEPIIYLLRGAEEQQGNPNNWPEIKRADIESEGRQRRQRIDICCAPHLFLTSLKALRCKNYHEIIKVGNSVRWWTCSSGFFGNTSILTLFPHETIGSDWNQIKFIC